MKYLYGAGVGFVGTLNSAVLTTPNASKVFQLVRCFRPFNTALAVLSAPLCRSICHIVADWFRTSDRIGDGVVISSQFVRSEKALIERARGGNRNAFGELVRRHSNRVYGMSFKMLKNREDAEDNLQNVFWKAYGKIRQFEGNSQFSTWLVRIAINEALMMLRKRRARNMIETMDRDQSSEVQGAKADSEDMHADPERQYLTKELTAKVFDVLSPELRSTFILQKGEGLTGREVAEALDISADTVKSRIFRARVRLRQRLLDITKTESIALQS
jgi:RNA polymerase sigma-70 factor, ECF subfamily